MVRRRWSDDEIEFVREHHGHMSLKDMGERLGREPKYVGQFARLRLGLKTRRSPKRAARMDREMIVRMYRDREMSTPEIARTLGVTHAFIGKVVRESGATRSPSEQREIIVRHRRGAGIERRPIIHRGYRFIHMPEHPDSQKATGYIAEHRVVMERKIGRQLTQREFVHHKNGNKVDNRPDNLMLVTGSEHRRIHNRRLSESELLSAIRACSRDIGSSPTIPSYQAWATSTGSPHWTTVVRRFGGWKNALGRCGIPLSPRTRAK